MKPNRPSHFNNRAEIAKYLNTSRMEIWRFEQFVRLTESKHAQANWISADTIDEWYAKAFEARFDRPYKPRPSTAKCNS